MIDKLRKLLEDRKATYVEKTPNDVYRDVAHNFDNFEASDIAAIGGTESSHGKFEEPIQGGSARGLFQIQPRTAEELIPGSSKTILDHNTQADLMKELLKRNNPENIEDAYLMHNLGKSGGKKVIGADDDQKASEVISSAAINSNKNLYKDKNIGKIKELLKKKLAESSDSSELRPNSKDLFKD